MSQLSKKRNENAATYPSLFSNFPTRFFGSSLWDDDFWNYGRSNSPLVNISETDREFNLEFSVPGLKREDIHVDVENGMLTISSEKEEESDDTQQNYRRREFSWASFSRSFQLPDNADENAIEARYENGVLKVTLPKKEMPAVVSKKQIAVK